MSRRVDRRKERKLLRDVYDALMDHWGVICDGASTSQAVHASESLLTAAVDRLQAFDAVQPADSQPATTEVLH